MTPSGEQIRGVETTHALGKAGGGGLTDEKREMREIAARLTELRLALGHTEVTTWARFVGINRSAWYNYEYALRKISLKEAMKLARKTGISLDYIYRGDDFFAYLPGNLQEKIEAYRSTNGGLKSA